MEDIPYGKKLGSFVCYMVAKSVNSGSGSFLRLHPNHGYTAVYHASLPAKQTSLRGLLGSPHAVWSDMAESVEELFGGRSETAGPGVVSRIGQNLWVPEGLGFGAPILNRFLLGI